MRHIYNREDKRIKREVKVTDFEKHKERGGRRG